MRQIRIFEHISLDGIIQPDGPIQNSDFANGGWTAPYRSPGGAKALADRQGQGFDLLLGRRTYDLWAGHWPKIKGGPFADGINAATKYVVTHRPDSLEWGPTQSLGEDFVAQVRRLKSDDGPDLIVWGSSTLTPLLLADGLIDEMVLIVYPILLGQGKRCFANNANPREFALGSSNATPTGVLVNTYRHVGPIRVPEAS